MYLLLKAVAKIVLLRLQSMIFALYEFYYPDTNGSS